MIRVHRVNRRGLSPSVPHYGSCSGTWLEIFNCSGSVIWTSGPERWLRDVKLVLEKEPLLSCRLMGQSVDVLEPELLCMLVKVGEREVRYRHYRKQVMAGVFGDFNHGPAGEGALSRADIDKRFVAYMERITECFIRSEIALGFVQPYEVGQRDFHAGDSAP